MTASSGAITTGDPGHAVSEHNPVAGLAHDSRGGISNPILGMILFICSEVMNSSIPRTTLLIPPRASCDSPATGLCSVVVVSAWLSAAIGQ